MANYYVSSAGWSAVAQWQASRSYSVGAYVRQLATPTFGNERVFKCTAAGTSGASEPSWTLTNGGNTTDSGVTWQQIAGREAEQAAANWKAPLATMDGLSIFSISAADTIFVSSDHSEAKGAALTLSQAAGLVMSVKRGVGSSMPPVEADIQNGAYIGTTGASAMTLSLRYAHGITFETGVGSSGLANLTISSASTILKDCNLSIATTSTSGRIFVGTSTSVTYSLWDNVKTKFASTSQGINVDWAELWWKNTATPVDAGGSTPTSLIYKTAANGANGKFTATGVDFSSYSGALLSASRRLECLFETCALNVAVNMPAAIFTNYGARPLIKFHNCTDVTGNNPESYEHNALMASAVDTAVYCSDGASDGVQNWSVRYNAADANLQTPEKPHEVTPISKRNNNTGASQTLSVEALVLATTTLPTKNQLYCDFYVLNQGSSLLSSRISSRSSQLDATAVDSSTKNWTAPARANSTAYSVGRCISVASNPGKVFMVVSGSGTSASSEPAGYASATYGGTVTDGSFMMRCLTPIKFSVSATPQQRGMHRAYVRPAAPYVNNLNYIWIDPKLRVA